MTDDVLETRLREHFAGRSSGEASPRLRDRLAAVPMGAAPAPRRPWLRLAGAAAAAVSALAFGLVLARIALVDRSLGPVIVGTPATLPPSSQTLMPGDGVTTPSVSLWFWLALVLIVGIIVLAIRALRRRRLPRWVDWVIVAVVTVVLLSALGRSTSGSDLVDQGSWAPGISWVEDTNGSDGLTPDRGGLFMPGRNGSFSFALPVTNNGSLPVTIHGLSAWSVVGVDGAEILGPSIVALGSPEPGQTWTGVLLPGPDGVAPWQPVTLWPGESAVLSVLGVGGPCAVGPSDAALGGAAGFASIPLVLDIAGYGYVEDVPITLVEVATTETCTSP
jgi:hypothetical protein